MSKFGKGVIATLIFILILAGFFGIAFVSNWFTLPTAEWGTRWNEIWGTISQSTDKSPIDLLIRRHFE